MQISSENYIAVLTEQVKALTIENVQLKAHILDVEAKAKGANDDKVEESNSQPTK
ncbi:hypothetical protein [Lactobacillus delbrueckii]|uniref:hypothetical protein n=1 Tax=Lactobacillus delbrueckii TaxID=1584 RepID=UPI001F27E582|nr:hypothetical protein [Lactobacillus delbrueckii]GHN43087.1 hypothetical protein ME797_04530 [Lactobacillus delbrueckii]